ncbi:MAG: acetyl-CoA C-acyltransferase [Deltaproteobacteria bacterium]|jgi:acetyl-CoA C-acetyltransferase|nr:acetyl-CoA C-acyltransferase [Deltaproteobacteria bacterium]MBW2543416.1 acetyl-CoA C-acyltransferase [Deltaproteobacteria bacterium]
MCQNNVVIASATRTPIGCFQGGLSSLSASDLGALVVREAVKRAGATPEQVDSVIMGNVLSAGIGQAPARQCVIKADFPVSTGAVTVNKVCGSGLQAVMYARREVMTGEADVVVAGGMESMTNAPYIIPKARAGLRLGNAEIVDSMVSDGLWDPYGDMHMGVCGDLVAERCGFTREDQDEFAATSYRRALAAQKEGRFKPEIVPVAVPQRRGEPLLIDDDEEPGRGKIDKFAGLRPAFGREGTVTAANASSLNDGAAALVVCSADVARERGYSVLAKIIADSSAAVEPKWFTLAPVDALAKLYAKTGTEASDWDLYEINEAFSGVTMAAAKEHSIPMEKINVNGGAVSLGHPIGCSGARVLVTLLYALADRKLKRGIATLCIGGGEAVALAVECV